MTQLSAEQIQANWNTFLAVIDTYITGDRSTLLKDLYLSMEEQTILAPAAIRDSNHNCFAGGYVDHVLRVVKASLQFDNVWKSFNVGETYSQEELVFAAINHDLGKLGLPGTPGVFPNDNDWQVKNQGAHYKFNTALSFASVPDRSLFILQSAGITVSENEYLGIKLHDGLYDEANKHYLISYQPESRLRSSLPIILHQADMLAARVEWEGEWLPRLNSGSPIRQTKTVTHKIISKPAASEEAMKRISSANPNLMAALKNI
jgi:hypothetical protein